MLDDLLIGALMIAWTATVHAGFMVFGFWLFRNRIGSHRTHFARASIVTALVLWYFLAVVVECWCWALVYMFLGVFDDLETAVYFSTVAFTTLGFGDIVLDESYRLLGAFEAAAGMVIFGWTTAMVFSAVQRIYVAEPAEQPIGRHFHRR